MTDVSQWDTADASNSSAAPAGAPEGMAPSAVNDVMRSIQGAVARWYTDTKGSLSSTGSSNTYALTSTATHAALSDQSLLVFQANHANTGAATLNVDSLGAKSLRIGGSALSGGEIPEDGVLVVAYNDTDDAYDLLGGFAVNGDMWSGTDLAIADGGTGASSASAARSNLGLGDLATQDTVNNSDWSGTELEVSNGGTGGGTPNEARNNLNIGSMATRDVTIQNGGSASGGSDGDVTLIW